MNLRTSLVLGVAWVLLLCAGSALIAAPLPHGGTTLLPPAAGPALGATAEGPAAIATSLGSHPLLRPSGGSLSSDVGVLVRNLTYNFSASSNPATLVAPIPMTSLFDPATGLIYGAQYSPYPFGDRLLTAVPGELALPNTTINLTQGPVSLTLDSANGLLYIPEQNQSGSYALLQTVDPTTDAVTGSYNLTTQGTPSATLFDPVNHNVYVTGGQFIASSGSNGGYLLAVDTVHGNSVSAPPGVLPAHFVPFAMTTDSNFSTLYIAGVFGGYPLPFAPGLIALNLTTYSETVRSIPVPNASADYVASSVAYDPADGSVYVGVGEDALTLVSNLTEYVAIYNASTLTYETSDALPSVQTVVTSVPAVASSLTYDPDNHDLYLTQGASYYGIHSGSGNLNATIIVLDGNLPTDAAPIAAISVPTFATSGLYVPPATPGGAGEMWFSSGPVFGRTNVFLGGFDILDLPPMARSLSATPALLDEGMGTELSASVVLGGGPLSYTYTGLPVGCASANLAQFACTPNATGTFAVTVSVADQFGRTTAASERLVVNPTLTIHPDAAPQPLDLGRSAGFTTGAAGGTPPLTVEWFFGDGASQSGNSVVHTYGAAGTYIVQLAVSDTVGAALQANLSVTVAAGPSSVHIAANRSYSDVGLPVAFSGGGTNGSLPLTYLWTFGDGGTGTGPTTTHTFQSTGVFLVTLTVRDAAGFSSSSSLAEVIGTAPQVALLAPHTSLTAGELGGFAASVSGGTAPFSYLWTFGGGTGSTAAIPLHAYAAAGTYTVSVEVTDAVGATASNSTTVSVVAAPAASSPSSTSGSCSG
ncbi:MAG: PKD domain-containing protein, partial [Thermoplasmata archaeon]